MANQDLMDLLKQAGFRGQGLANAYAIAMAESGGRARAHNPNASTGDNSYGLFQINMLGRMGPARLKQYGLSSNDDLFDPLTNAKVAYKMSHGGTNFQPWSTFKSGKYKDFLGKSGAQVTGDQTDMASAETPATTAEDYGYVKAFLKKHPDVARVVRQAVAAGYTPQRFAAEVKGTKWWKTRNDSQRKWDVLTAENPKEAARQKTAKINDLVARGRAMGISLSRDEAAHYAQHALTYGYTDTELSAVLAHEYRLPGSGHAGAGTAGEADQQLLTTAAQFGITLDSGTRQKYVRSVLAGTADVSSFEDAMREQAKHLYPSIAKQLDAGITTQQFLSPYMSAAADQLGVPVESMQVTDPKWNRALSGGMGKPDVPLNMDEWMRTIRTGPEYKWNQTLNAKQQASALATQMAQTMGGLG